MSFAKTYMRHLAALIESVDSQAFDAAVTTCRRAADRGGKVMLAGNGASAAMASHIAVDLTKVARIRGVTFNEVDLITCFANDYGYDQWVARAIEAYGDKGDVVVLISSSGRSPSVVNAAAQARRQGIPVVTLTGFDAGNPLRQQGDVNLWVDDARYNFVEATHLAWLVAMVDAMASAVEPS